MSSFYPALYQAALRLLVEAREGKGLERIDLATRLGWPESLVISYELGERLLDPAEFISVARAISVDPYELLRQAEECSS